MPRCIAPFRIRAWNRCWGVIGSNRGALDQLGDGKDDQNGMSNLHYNLRL
jgi:hypothetical protein